MNIIPLQDIDKWVAANRTQLERVDGAAGIQLLLKWLELRQKKRLDNYRREHPAKHDDCVGNMLCSCPACVGEDVDKKS